MKKPSDAWRKLLELKGATDAQADAVELATMRYLERTSGYPRPADSVLNAVVGELERQGLLSGVQILVRGERVESEGKCRKCNMVAIPGGAAAPIVVGFCPFCGAAL